MWRDGAYRKAERRIEQARREGATKLYLGHIGITKVPESLDKLTQLRSLYLSINQLTSLPESLGNLMRLQELNLYDNKLTSLPESLGNLIQLQSLNLRDNKLTSLPESLGKLTQLRELNLHSNHLTNLPASLGQLPYLKNLDLDDNPLNPALAVAYKQGTDVLLQFLREQAVEEVVLNEAKLILVGEGAVGKSSLLGALRGDPWVEKRDTTHGVEVKPVHLTAPGSGVELTLNGWDFGGQPVYRPTHQLFFSAPAVYLVVWEPRKGPEQGFVNYWTKLIKHRAYDEKRPHERPRVLVVATHGGPKERQAHIDEQALRDQFGALVEGFYHVDSKPDSDSGQCPGLDALEAAIARTAAAIPYVGRKVPGSWKRVMDAVKARAETDPYVTYRLFEELCQSQGVAPDLAATYTSIMNELGHLIHYGDDEGLKDVVILKAEWLSKAISFVLEDRVVKEQNGLIHHSRLGEVWNDPARPEAERYPPALHPIFLRLMERFDLSYRVMMPEGRRAGEPPDTSLIAQLVPGARHPELGDDWGPEPEAGDVQRAQVCRVVDATTGDPAQAEGLIYRLIVRLHRYSLGRADYLHSRHWQLGLLLDDDYNGRALLEQIGGDVRITVRAAYPERFLHMLSEEVKWLVEYFWKGLDCRITVPCRPPCRGLFEIDALIESRREDRTEYPCPACRKWANIDSLLAKPAKMPALNVALAELRRGQVEIKQGQDIGFQSVRTDLRRLISQADEQFAQLMTTLTDEARDGPRLFSLTPVEPDRWGKPGWISQKVRLTLWCEHSRVPVPELWDDHPPRGVYEFDIPREWLLKMAPLARLMAGVLSLTLPVAGSAVKLAMDETVYKQIEKNLDISQKSFSALLDAGGAAGKWMAHDDEADLSGYADQAEEIRGYPLDERHYGRPRAAHGGLLRELQSLLRERDPGFGGLKRVQNKRREYLWIHPRFEKEYYPDPPVIPPPPG